MKLFPALAAAAITATLWSVNSAMAKSCRAEFIENHVMVDLGVDKDGTPIWNGLRVADRSKLESYFTNAAMQRNVYFHVPDKEKTNPRMRDLIADAKRHGLRFSDCEITVPLIKPPPTTIHIVQP